MIARVHAAQMGRFYAGDRHAGRTAVQNVAALEAAADSRKTFQFYGQNQEMLLRKYATQSSRRTEQIS